MEFENRLLLRIPECAQMLGLGRSYAYELVRSGRIPSVRVGAAIRVPREALVRWVADLEASQNGDRSEVAGGYRDS